MMIYGHRAKSRDTGKWVFGDAVHTKYGTALYNKDAGFIDVRLETLDKYIGSYDENKLPIFEEDFVKLTCVKGNQTKYFVEMVIFDPENCLYVPFFLKNTVGQWGWKVKEIVVIGNKQDNPDIKTGWTNG